MAMPRSPSTTRILFALAPLLGLTPACSEDKRGPVGSESAGDSEGDSKGEYDSATSTTSDDDEGESTTDGVEEPDPGSTTETPETPPDDPPDECGWFLEGMTRDEIQDLWTDWESQAWGEPEIISWCDGEHSMPCTTEGGQEGTSLCILSWEGEVWTTCMVEHACTPDTKWEQGECGGNYCELLEGRLTVSEWTSPDPCCGADDPCCNTPLVVSFDGEPIRFEAAGAAAFDIGGQGACLSTDWPVQPWLAIDRDGDGIIGSGRELFGSGTIMTTGARASHGFEALAEFDVDRDGKITAADPIFHELVLWTDHDSDRRGALGELMPVAQAELIAIDLGFGRRYDCDGRGNCGVERSAFEFRDELGTVRMGEVVDVHMACQ